MVRTHDFNLVIGQVRQCGGGTFSFTSLRPLHPAKGFAVSLSGVGLCVPDRLFNARTLRRYLVRCARNDAYLGVWLSGGFVFLDVSQIVPDREHALLRAKTCHERSVYDFQTGSVIWTGEPNRQPRLRDGLDPPTRAALTPQGLAPYRDFPPETRKSLTSPRT